MSDCKWCRRPWAVLPGWEAFRIVRICLHCDTAPATNPGNRLVAGPPKLPGSKNGWILPPED